MPPSIDRLYELEVTEIDLRRAQSDLEARQLKYPEPLKSLVVGSMARVFASLRDPQIESDAFEAWQFQIDNNYDFSQALARDCIDQALATASTEVPPVILTVADKLQLQMHVPSFVAGVIEQRFTEPVNG